MVVSVVYAFGFTLFLAGRASFWGDEGFAAGMTQLRWGRLVRDLGHIDVNMSLYYAFAKLWVGVFGLSEVGLRSFSVLCAFASLVATYRLGLRLFDRRWACWLVALVTVNPFFLRVALTARPYAMVMLASLVATLLLLRALEQPALGWWVVYGMLAGTSLYIHMTAALYIAAHAVFLVVTRSVRGRGPRVAGVIIAVATIPTVAYIAPVNTLAWIGKPTVRGVVTIAARTTGSPVLLVVFTLAVLGGLFTIVQMARRATATAIDWFPVVATLVPISVVLVLLPFQSLLIELYFAVVFVPMAALATRGIMQLARPRSDAVVLAVVVLSMTLATIGLWQHPTTTDQKWRSAAKQFATLVHHGDAVAFPDSFYRITAEHYSRRDAGWTAAVPILPSAPWDTLRPYELDRTSRLGVERTPEAIDREIVGHDRIWLVGPDTENMHVVVQALTRHGYRLEAERQVTNIVQDLYVASS